MVHHPVAMEMLQADGPFGLKKSRILGSDMATWLNSHSWCSSSSKWRKKKIVLGILSQLLVWKKSYRSAVKTSTASPHPHLNKKRSSCPWTIRRLKILSVFRNPGPSNKTSSMRKFWHLEVIQLYIYIQVSEVMGVTPWNHPNISKSWMIMT